MLALSLWLSCAALAEPPTPATAPPAAEAASPVGDPVPVVVSEAPAAEPARPEPAPAPFVLTGFLPADRLALDAVVSLGTTFDSLDGGVDVHARYRGFLAGVIVSGTTWSSNSDHLDWTRALGLEAGYAWSPARLRLEGAIGYGRATDRRDPPAGAEQSTGNFLRVRLAGDYLVAGGEGWRAAVGVGAWWRDVQGLSWSPADHQEFGVALRLCGELGW